MKAQFGKLGLSRRGMYARDDIVITASLLTIASYNYSYIRLAHLRIRYAPREYYKRYANAICDTQIRYGSCEYDMRNVNTQWTARMQYAIRKYATGLANAICHTRIGYAL